MKHIITLILALSCISVSAKECTSLVQIIEIAQQNHGSISPIYREDIIKLVQLKVLPATSLNKPESFYVEFRTGKPLVRLFNMNNGCADKQWMFPIDFLMLLGWQTA